jgi:hypothetical protein
MNAMLAIWLAFSSLACGGTPPAPARATKLTPPTACRYDVTMSSSAELVVKASCDTPLHSFVASESVMANGVHLRTADGSDVSNQAASFIVPTGTREVTYRIDLGKVARKHADIDVALEAAGTSQRAWIAAVSTWILRPHPISATTRATIHVTVPDGMGFATGLTRVDDHYELLARQIRFATYSVFGQFASEDISLPGPLALEPAPSGKTARIRLITLPGALATSVKARSAWVRDTAEVISDFWRGFPMDRTMVVLIPTAEHGGIAHGKVVATGGASVAIHIGSRARRPDLYSDWILVHELFHLGFPSFSGEGKWLDEGLATYFEPIIRARGGRLTPSAMWSEFANGLGQGLPAVEGTGVEKTETFQGIYWGGAIIALLADVKTRQRSGGKLGLEDGLRAVLAEGGDASHLWKLDRAIDVIDKRLGAPTLRELADAHSFSGRPVDLPQLWVDLGVQRQGDEVVLDHSATLALVRDAILSPR